MTLSLGVSGSRVVLRTARLSLIVAGAGLVAMFSLQGAAQHLALGILLLAAAVAFLACLASAPDARVRGGALTGAVSSLGLVGSVLYLHALPDDSADIPLAGVGVLFLSLVGMVVAFLLLKRLC